MLAVVYPEANIVFFNLNKTYLNGALENTNAEIRMKVNGKQAEEIKPHFLIISDRSKIKQENLY